MSLEKRIAYLLGEDDDRLPERVIVVRGKSPYSRAALLAMEVRGVIVEHRPPLKPSRAERLAREVRRAAQ